MGKMIAYGAAAILSFALAAGGSWYLNREPEEPEDAASAEVTEADGGDATAATEEKGKTADSGAGTASEQPPSVVAAGPLTAEGLFRLGEQIREREERLLAAEKAQAERARQLDLALKDIQSFQEETDGILEELRGAVTIAQTQVDELVQANAVRQQMMQQEQEASTKPTSKIPTPQEQKNLKKLAESYMAMAPEKASEQLSAMANDGDIDTVVRILDICETKKRAKILEAMSQELGVDIAKRLYELQPAPKEDKNK